MRGYRRNLGSEILQFHRERFSAARSVWTPSYRATPPGERGSKRIAECIRELCPRRLHLSFRACFGEDDFVMSSGIITSYLVLRKVVRRGYQLLLKLESRPVCRTRLAIIRCHRRFHISSLLVFAVGLTPHDERFPPCNAFADRRAFISLLSLHSACPNSCATARSSRSSVLIPHRTMSSPMRWGTVATNASSMKVSLFGRYVNAGLSESIPRGITTYFQSAERTSTQVHPPSSAVGYFARVFLKTAISAWHLLKL